MAQGEMKGTQAEHWSKFLAPSDNASYSLNPDFIPFAAQSLQGILPTRADLSRNFQVALNKEFSRREALVKSFSDKTNLSPDFLQEQLRGEFLHVRFQSNQLQNNNQVLLMPLKDAAQVRAQIEKMQEALRMHDSGTGMGTMESYDGLNFQNLPLEEWPYLWLGPGFQGFSRVFVAELDGILILGNSRAAIQTTRDHWNKLQRNATSESISLSKRIYLPYYQRIMQQELRPSWLNEWNAKRPFWEKLQQVNWQLWASGSGNMNLKLDIFFDQQTNNVQELGIALLNNVDLGTPLSRHLKLHVRAAELKQVLVFTANHQLVSISDNSLNWSYAAAHRPMSGIAILDYFGDGSIYYLWIDEQAQVHLLESSGNPVPGFPQKLNGPQVPLRMAQQLMLAGNEDFHFLVQDAAGALHQFDRFFNVLPTSGPQRLSGNVLPGSQSQMYRGEKLFSYHTTNGLIYLSRADGSLLPGFPVDVKKRMNSPLIWTAAAVEAAARMLSISEDGEVIRVGTDGQIKGRDQLYRPSRESKFAMAVDEQSGGYVFIRLNYNEMTVFSSSMQELFTAAVVPGEAYTFQFFMASPIASYLILSDPVQEFAYVYDMQGNLVGGQPIASGGKVQWIVNPDGQSFRIFSTYGQNLLTFGFKP
jgi:hypothetical protein